MNDSIRFAIDTIPGLVWSSLPDGSIDYLNQRWLEYTGLPLELATGSGWQAAVFPDDLPGLLEIWRKVLASGAPGEAEARLRRHDGVFRWFLFRAEPLYDFAGALVKWYGQSTDIDDRKQAEALLAGENRMLEMIAKGGSLTATLDALCRLAEADSRSLAAILLLDSAGCHIRNGAAPSLPESFIRAIDGRPVGPGFGPCDTAACLGEQVIAADLGSDNRWPAEYRALARSHGLAACWSTPIASPEGKTLGTFAIYSRQPGTPTPEQQSRIGQLTHLASIAIERTRSIDALRRSEQRYALAVDAAGDGHTDWIVASDEFYASPRLLEMCGLPADTTFRSRADFLSRFPFHPDDRDRVVEAINTHFGSGTARLEVDIRILRRGATRRLHLTGLCSHDASGALVRWNAAVTDVTDRHLAEEELQRMEQQLRQAQRLEAMGTLAGGIAHDFNNLLGAILGYGEMALRDVPSGSRLRRDLESIMIAGERGRALVDRILAFSRSGVGERLTVHVEEVVRETVALLSSKLPDGITIDNRLHSGGAAVMGDATQIQQVVMNLVSNAIQAMPSGGTARVSIACHNNPAPRAATTGTLAARDYVVLEVADTGSGIRPEILERIFDPFFTTKEAGVGTGLGLSLVHGIVTGLGGAIDVATTVGTGSVFTVYLPRAGDVAKSGKSRPRTQLKSRRGDRQRVLVVDDEESLVRLVTETLSELGYAPVGFTTGAAALGAFLADPKQFDAVITDESMPGMSGSELILRLRKIRPTVPILLLSGYLGTAVVRRARDAGANEVLKKPLSARELATSLDRVLQDAKDHRGSRRVGLTGSRPGARRGTEASSRGSTVRR